MSILKLDRYNIRNTILKADDFLERSGVEAATRTKYRLLLEEILLDYMKKAPDTEFRLVYKSRLRSISMSLHVKCESCDILSETGSPVRNRLLKNFGPLPQWSYHKGENVYLFTPPSSLPDLKNVKKILLYMMKQKTFLLGVIIRFIQMIFNIIEPILTAAIIVAYTGSEMKKIYIVAALLLGQAALSSLLNYAGSRLLRNAYSGMMKRLKFDLTENILRIKTDCMDEKGSGVFTQRLITETSNIAEHLDSVLNVSTEVFRLLSLMIAFLLLSVNMFVYEMILFVFYILIQKAHLRNLTDDDRKYRSAMEKHTSFAGEMVRAHRDIKLLHCEDSFIKKLDSSIEESIDVETAMRVRSMKFILLRTQFVSWTDFIYMALLALHMSLGAMTASAALVLFSYNGRFFICSRSVSSFMDSLNGLALSSERIYQLMNSDDYEKETFGEKHIDEVKGDIELRDLKFSYRRANGSRVNVLNGMNLHIKSGEFVAFVGGSGCGKSTVLSLISRLYDPDEGSVLLDGCDIRELDMDSIRSNIGMVSQMPYIFNMSIRDNLSVVKADMTDEEMISACKTACIHDDIMKLPQGYNTIVGEGGITLSGGQRQRLAIARSIVRRYPIIMFDEATSALDNITQAKIRTAIDNLQGSRTVIMIAHRLSTVINCEHLFFLSGGKVIAEGTHKELLENCKEYRALYLEEGGESDDN